MEEEEVITGVSVGNEVIGSSPLRLRSYFSFTRSEPVCTLTPYLRNKLSDLADGCTYMYMYCTCTSTSSGIAHGVHIPHFLRVRYKQLGNVTILLG